MVEKVVSVFSRSATGQLVPLVVAANPLVGDPLGSGQHRAAAVSYQQFWFPHRRQIQPETRIRETILVTSAR